ncbi:hypothetical protein ABFA25_04360 [Mycobacterium lepromatosis]
MPAGCYIIVLNRESAKLGHVADFVVADLPLNPGLATNWQRLE